MLESGAEHEPVAAPPKLRTIVAVCLFHAEKTSKVRSRTLSSPVLQDWRSNTIWRQRRATATSAGVAFIATKAVGPSISADAQAPLDGGRTAGRAHAHAGSAALNSKARGRKAPERRERSAVNRIRRIAARTTRHFFRR